MKLRFCTVTQSCLGLALLSGLLVSIGDANAQTSLPSFSAHLTHPGNKTGESK